MIFSTNRHGENYIFLDISEEKLRISIEKSVYISYNIVYYIYCEILWASLMRSSNRKVIIS